MKFLLVISFFIFSINIANAAGQSLVGKISLLNIGNGVVFVQLTDSSGMQITTNPDSCSDVDAYLLLESNSHFTEVFTGLMLGRSVDANVKVYLDGCDNTNTPKHRPKISSVIIL